VALALGQGGKVSLPDLPADLVLIAMGFTVLNVTVPVTAGCTVYDSFR
jgi:hypothetical protein